MPKISPQPDRPPGHPPDRGTLVDRWMDRLKNNRLAAVLTMLFLAIGALASLTDSTKKLFDSLPSFSSVTVAGEWKSDLADFYGNGPEFMRINLQQAVADQIIGTVQFSGNHDVPTRSFDIIEVKREGNKLTISFDNGFRPGILSLAEPARDTATGEINGDQFSFVFRRGDRLGLPVTAWRIPQTTQLVDGRLAIVYHDKEYADHQAACVQLLRDQDPPEKYKLSEPPDEYGNIHCVGLQAGGSAGFDMFQNDVQQSLVCPAHSRITVPAAQPAASLKRCECDGRMVASGPQCVAK
jgi:hypothetical protein